MEYEQAPAAWVMVWVLPAMVIRAVRAAPLLAATVTVTLPLPVPLVGDRVTQERFAGTAVVQLQAALLAVTATT